MEGDSHEPRIREDAGEKVRKFSAIENQEVVKGLEVVGWPFMEEAQKVSLEEGLNRHQCEAQSSSWPQVCKLCQVSSN